MIIEFRSWVRTAFSLLGLLLAFYFLAPFLELTVR